MSLYEDLDTEVSKQVPDWSSGINKLIPQPQLQMKNKIPKIQPVPKKPAMVNSGENSRSHGINIQICVLVIHTSKLKTERFK